MRRASSFKSVAFVCFCFAFEKTVEIPLYYRKNVDLVSSKLGNYFSNPTSAGPTWNAVDWYVK